MYSIVEGRDFALKGGKPGFRTSDGKWIPIDTEKFDKKELDRLTADYARRRGSSQIEKDKAAHKAEKAKQDAARSRSRSSTSSPSPTPAASPSTRIPSASESPRSSATARTAPVVPSRPSTSTSAPKPIAQTGNKANDMAVWRSRFPELATKVTSAGTQRGTEQSTMAKQAVELRSMQKASQERQASQSSPMYSSPDVKTKMSTRTKKLLGVSEQYDAFDLVLDYLLTDGHVESLEEALYVMMEMDTQTIMDIVEGVMPEPIDPVAHKAAQKTQKIYNLGKGTNNPNEAQSALKRTGPQLPGV